MNVVSVFCPLCESIKITHFHADNHRDYFQCTQCHLIFVPSQQFLSKIEEKKRYDLHQNSPDDKSYREFLNKLFNPLHQYLNPKSNGLDFGSGPGPTLSLMFEETGHTMAIYDYFYANKNEVFQKQYDFITATEVLEHLYNPKKELMRLWSCLKPNGRLGIMTKLMFDDKEFIHWYYKNDPTHVCFYSPLTFKWLAKQWKADVQFIGEDVIIFFKNEK